MLQLEGMIDDIVRVKFSRSGGFTGLVESCDFMLETLAPFDRKQLLDAFRKISGVHIPAVNTYASDLETYDVDIFTAESTQSIRFQAGSVPSEALGLLRILKSHARLE